MEQDEEMNSYGSAHEEINKDEEGQDADDVSQQGDKNDSEAFDPEKKTGAEFVATLFDSLFDDVEQADSFYILYATETGFNPRRSTIRTDKKSSRVIAREWVCASAGTKKFIPKADRQRPVRFTERSDCRARFRIIRCRITGKYKVTHFVTEHNHRLKLDPDERRYLKFNRYLSAARMDIMSRLTDSGIRPCNVFDFLKQAGGANGNGVFIPRDGYNYLNKQKMMRVKGGDANALFNLIEGMKLKDPSMVLDWTLDDSGQLNKLFWCDGRSIADYKLFGDALIFDSTYKVNKYLFPFIMFSGVNSHLQTCVFGCGFLQNETIESYRWLLQHFKKAMGNEPPKAVLTDQDPSMKKAIEEEFEGVPHRFCCWHISRNAESNVKVPNFSTKFSSLMNRVCTIEEFESKWQGLMAKFPDAATTSWVKDIYEKREHWAEAYFRGKFYAMMRSTQRCESLNAHLKRKVYCKLSLTDFYTLYTHHFMDTIRERFQDLQIKSEREAEHVNEDAVAPLEKMLDHARRICTKNVYAQISDEFDLIGKICAETRSGDAQCHTIVYTDSSSLFCPFKEYITVIDLANSSFKCTCRMLESDGIPCRHIAEGLQGLKQTSFPEGCIHPRWFTATGRQIRIDFPHKVNVDPASETAGKVAELLITKVQNAEFYEQNKVKIDELTTALSNAPLKKTKRGIPPTPPKHPSGVKDPKKIVPKGGAQRKKQRCTDCGFTGHNRSTCEKKKKEAALLEAQAQAANIQTPLDDSASNDGFFVPQNNASQNNSNTQSVSFMSLLQEQTQQSQRQAQAQAQAHMFQPYNNLHYYPQIPINPTYFHYPFTATPPQNGQYNASPQVGPFSASTSMPPPR